MTEAELTAIRERVANAQTGWEVYRCQFANEEPDSACGLNGQTYDCSYDECHHPMSLSEAEYICMICNAAPALLSEIERLRELHQACMTPHEVNNLLDVAVQAKREALAEVERLRLLARTYSERIRNKDDEVADEYSTNTERAYAAHEADHQERLREIEGAGDHEGRG